MTKTQVNTLFLFIGICHGVIEETIVFTSIGANGLIILASRFTAALIFTFVHVGTKSGKAKGRLPCS